MTDDPFSTAPLEPSDIKLLTADPPPAIADLAEACVRFVAQSLKTKLDYTVESLPLLDHYLLEARQALSPQGAQSMAQQSRAEIPSIDLVSRAAGAYLGEVIRRRHACWWRESPDEPRLELHRLELVIYPTALILDALMATERVDHALSGFELEESDRPAAEARLANLPPVEFEEFVRPSTRVETLDIIVDAVRAQHAADGAEPLELEPSDYVH